MRFVLFALPVLAFLGLVVYFATPLLRGTDPSFIASPMIDVPIPNFTLPPLPGHDHGLDTADLKGQAQIVNVFASYCIPCRAEAPLLMALAKDHHVTIRGIAFQDKPENTLAYLSRLGDPYKSIGVDSDGKVGIDLGAYGMPETYIVDAQGRIRYRKPAPLTPADVRDTILPLLAKLNAN
jgi:cytochrome c biogenesis protein CcmG/thiol:disulfide interchange protein DsbE